MNNSAAQLSNLLTPYETVSIIGMSKNAGKTTVLNSLIAEYTRRKITIGITSIGRDGEDTDILTATAKPRIFVGEGTLIATTTELLQKCDITKEIMRTTGIPTALGEVVLIAARSDGYIQIGGGTINAQVARICREFKELGAQKILVDGAFSRRAVATPSVSEAVILSCGASLHPDMMQVVRDTAFTAAILSIKSLSDERLKQIIATSIIEPSLAGSLAIHTDTPAKITIIDEAYSLAPFHFEKQMHRVAPAFVFIKGALTDKIIADLCNGQLNLRRCKIIVEDSSKLLISRDSLDKLNLRGIELVALKPLNLVAITANPTAAAGYAFDKDLFLQALRECVRLPVFDLANRAEDPYTQV